MKDIPNFPTALSNVTHTYLQTYDSILNKMISSMSQTSQTDSISYSFILQMIPHHQAAIQMSENLLRYTTNIPLQNIALQIIEEQTKNIENMQQIQFQSQTFTNSKQDLSLFHRKLRQIMHIMFFEMKHAPILNQINTDFIYEMIPHHEGAVKISETTLQYPICPKLKPLLTSIISSQEKSISKMQYLLQCIE
ncbi:MAG: DUF305 domain-containing protein [Lachnospiraceae bacterium]|nr:DUF305 domain-containing protein [Lachnospiraceae bacterium]